MKHDTRFQNTFPKLIFYQIKIFPNCIQNYIAIKAFIRDHNSRISLPLIRNVGLLICNNFPELHRKFGKYDRHHNNKKWPSSSQKVLQK